jgi:hypothetical protein
MQFGSWIASGLFHFDYLTLASTILRPPSTTASRCLSLFFAEEKIAEEASQRGWIPFAIPHMSLPRRATQNAECNPIGDKIPQRPPKPGLNRGRGEVSARRAFYGGGTVTTPDVVQMAYARKMLICGRRPEPHDFRLARRALELIAVRIGRLR